MAVYSFHMFRYCKLYTLHSLVFVTPLHLCLRLLDIIHPIVFFDIDTATTSTKSIDQSLWQMQGLVPHCDYKMN